MAGDGASFLPRLKSVFYAHFDPHRGPEIAYQVPEGLIASSAWPISGGASPIPSGSSRASSIVFVHPDRSESRIKSSPHKNSISSSRTLLNFDDISKYIIAQSPLCGRLVTCTAGTYKVLGFPVQLSGQYERNYFRFNVCFVFDAGADLSCYEPVVRKVNRVLTACEEESLFLSSPETSFKIHAILEQLYEDLNSYSETSIPIDNFNSIELKIFPFYPNPPPVKDWMVPVALINFKNIIGQNWDLTMAKVCQHIDGTKHVARIAHLAGCDIVLTRQAISHLLYYQVIMTIDIFQYSNMYTLRKSIQWLADEAHVKDECGPFVIKEGRAIPDWPEFLHLYSRMRPGKTVFEWMQDHDVRSLGIDVRRFASFGVIKGFLRRVHRWPVLLNNTSPPPIQNRPPPLYLLPLLDGEHHTDELCCRFEVGWPTLERWLTAVGEGSGDGDFGKVLMIYR
ncbi:nitrogen permease regulator 2 [Lactifluus volemus]|nr:nitrogen permease regulator 2 [Lactifluus volemus]